MKSQAQAETIQAGTVNPTGILMHYACGHSGRVHSPYMHMVSPRTLQAYVDYLGMIPCGDCRAEALATVTSPAGSSIPGRLAQTFTGTLRGIGSLARGVAARQPA
jgi:hypothetical protein